jgi:monofunctional biosynthetic peptidoglycan transglycosylase
MSSWLTNKLRRWYRALPRDENQAVRWKYYFLRLAFKFALWFVGISLGFTILYRFLPIPFTPLMLIRTAQQMMEEKREVRLKKDWVSLEEISPLLQLAVVCSEDQQFLEHDGFDINAIQKAYKLNKKGKRKRGASTISQQTAKNTFLWPSRTWLRKGLEVWFTLLIERLWDKENIMEAYLNIIEFGDGIYGAEAAAQFYYQKKAKDLNRKEAAMLAAILPSPLRLNPRTPTPALLQKQQWIIQQMRYWGKGLDYDEPNTPAAK